MKKKPPRMTQATKMVLREMLADPAAHYYGLQLIKATALPGGTLYPIMARLERAGWVTGDWEESDAHIAEGRPPRRYYRFTDDGAGQARAALVGAYRPGQRRRLDFGVPWSDLPGMPR